MAEYCITSFIYLFILLVTNINAKSEDYIDFGLDNADICNPANDKVNVIEVLRKKKDSAIIVQPSHAFDTWRVNYNKHCRFRIKATKGEGLFAVIQKMSLRRNGSECIDFIRFVPDSGAPSDKYCGKINYNNGIRHYIPTISLSEYDPPNTDYQSSNQYTTEIIDRISLNGKIYTEIFISKQPLQQGESLDLVIIYTPFKDCAYSATGTLFWTSPTHIKPCVNSKFVCDGYPNCASLLCSDESNCTSVVNRIESDGIGTKVTVSAVTTIFLCLIIFILCLWICRKHKKLCWSPDCAGPTTTVSGNTSGLPMERGDQNASNQPYVPTAPMLEVAVPTSLHDKDLPPSYDSLFPSQANAANP